MTLYIDTPHTSMRVKNHGFFVKSEDNEQLIMPNKVSVLLLSNAIMLNTDVLLLALTHKIPVYIEDNFGNIKIQCRSTQFSLEAHIRRSQVVFLLNTQKRITWCKQLYVCKINSQLRLVRYLANRKKRLKDLLVTFSDASHEATAKIQKLGPVQFDTFRESVQGIEGSLARKYWSIINESLDEPWRFKSRNRQPAVDPFNASLNYLYAMMYREVENQIYLAGLDAHQGIFHGDQYQKPVLSFDFIEHFRPWVDKLLIQLIWSGELTIENYYMQEKACLLNAKAKTVLIPSFIKLMKTRKMYLDRNARTQDHIRIEIEKLKAQF